MSEEKKEINEIHKKFAVNLFNKTWDLIEKKDRTKEEDDKMIHCAHASRYHWGEIGQPINFERGEWQISRVYSILGKGTQALEHASRCLEICEQQNIADFDIAFAYEGLARGYSVLGDNENKKKCIKLAKDAAENIEKKGDKDYTLSEINNIK